MKDHGHALSDQYTGIETHENTRRQGHIETPGRR
jgi:hypothetical protein